MENWLAEFHSSMNKSGFALMPHYIAARILVQVYNERLVRMFHSCDDKEVGMNLQILVVVVVVVVAHLVVHHLEILVEAHTQAQPLVPSRIHQMLISKHHLIKLKLQNRVKSRCIVQHNVIQCTHHCNHLLQITKILAFQLQKHDYQVYWNC